MEKKTDYTEYVPARIQEQIKSKNTNTVLGFLICYGTKYKNEEGWFHIGNDHMVKQTGLNVRAINRAKDILRANSLIINYNQGTANKEEGNKQCEYLLDWDRIFSDDCDHLVNDTNLLILEELRRIRECQEAYLKALQDFEGGWTKRVDKLLECLEVSTPNDHPYISERSKNISDSTDSSKVYGDNTPEGIRNDTKEEKKKEKNKENLHTHDGTRTLAGTEPYAGTRSLTVQVEKTKKDFSSFSSSESSTDQEPNVTNQEPNVHVYTKDDYSELQADVVSYGIRLSGHSTDEQQEIKREFCEWLNGLTFSLEAAEFEMREKLLKLFEGYLKQCDEQDQTTEIPDEWDRSLQPVVQDIDKKYIETVSDWTKAYIAKFRSSSALEKHIDEARQKINDNASNEKTREMALDVFNRAVGEKIRALKFKEFIESQQKDAV